MSTLGAVLQGLDRGVQNGLDLYKTVQDEARQKRLDARQEKRDGIEDQRYEQSWNRQVEQDALAVYRDERNHSWEKDKFSMEQERLEAAATATAQHRASMQKLQAANYNLKAGKEQRAIKKEQRAEWDGRIKNGMDVYAAALKDNPDAAQDIYAKDVYARIGVNQRVAQANGMDLDAQTASELYAMPRPDGTYVIGRHTGKGFTPYDANPDAEGEQALVMPADVFMRTFGGTEASHAFQGQQQAAAAKNELASRAAQQFEGENAQVLADAAGAEQQLAAIDSELETLRNTPLMVTGTDYRGKQSTRANPRLADMGLAAQGALDARVAELEAARGSAQNQVDGMLGRQAEVRENASRTLADGVTAVSDATQGKTGQDKGFAATNAARTLAAGLDPAVAAKGLAPAEAQVESAKMTDTQMNRIKSQVAQAKQQLPKGEISPVNEAKLTASIATAMEDIGGIPKWQESARGQAASLHITGELYKRGLEFGYGFMAKVAMSNPKGAQIDAGLEALQSKVVKAFDDPVDRENVALLAARKIGSGKGQTQDPEAALMMAIKEYNGPAPTLSAAGR